MTRSVEELRCESERNRAQLAATVDRLREQITDTAEDLRYKVSPQGIKSEVSEFVSRKTHSWLDALKQQAMENPMQAIAAGTAVAVPALRLARGFPLPLLMMGRPCPDVEVYARPRNGCGRSGGEKCQGNGK